jgi:polyphosphate kinase
VDECKVHSKVLLITRKTEKSIQYITQIGTGNYNKRTARQYTDLSLVTSNAEIGLDAVALFNDILVNNIAGQYKRLLVAPSSMRQSILNLIHQEIDSAAKGEPASIFAKFNSLTDKDIIDKLVEASRSGVKIRLIVRGICCLRPGIPGLTNNISVISIVGRFLEHARVYCFGEGERRRVFISSADRMTRNTERRIEVACPILDKDIADRIMEMMETAFSDNVKVRELMPDGSYVRRMPAEKDSLVDSQLYLFKQ